MKLADGEDEPFDFDDSIFEEAAEFVRDEGGFDASKMSDPKVQAVIRQTAGAINKAVSSSLPHEVPDTLRHALENNAFIFSGFKTFRSLREVGLSLVTKDGAIKPLKDFEEDVHKINEKYNHNYLYAEYNHAVGSSVMAAKWHDMEEDGDDYNLQYRTAGDDRVREEHAALHGTTLPASDPFWDKYYPPNGWNCRCTVVQVRKEKFRESDPEQAMKLGDDCTSGPKREMFRYNAGKDMELFPPKHPYYPSSCNTCPFNTDSSFAGGKGRGDCGKCKKFADVAQAAVAKQIEKSRVEYNDLGNEWKREFFNESNGGYLAVHQDRIKKSQVSGNEKEKYNKEHSMARNLANAGYCIKLLKDGQYSLGDCDITVNGILADLKKTKSVGNIEAYAKETFGKKQGKIVVFEFSERKSALVNAAKGIPLKDGYKIIYYFSDKPMEIFEITKK